MKQIQSVKGREYEDYVPFTDAQYDLVERYKRLVQRKEKITLKSQIAHAKQSPMMNDETMANIVLLHDEQANHKSKLAGLPQSINDQNAASKHRNTLPKSTLFNAAKSGSFQPEIDKMDEFTEGDPKVLKTEQNYELLQPEDAGMQISLHEYIMN